MKLNNLYFYTATIVGWNPLLESDKYKDMIMDSLKFLVDRKKIAIYGFVIMPNHIHLIWELLELNGKEYPHASFMKFTSHWILKDMRLHHPEMLKEFRVTRLVCKDTNQGDRTHQFWQRDSLPVHLYSPYVIYQKLNYIHNNPVKGKWKLADSPIDYKYSSAIFYETEIDIFGLLTPISERI